MKRSTEIAERFVKGWGEMTVRWGLPKTLGYIHGLLLSSAEPLKLEDIEEELDMASSTIKCHLKTLIEWELVTVTQKTNGRTTRYYSAEKDAWGIMRKIILRRKEKELQPLLDLLDEVKNSQEQLDAKAAEIARISDEFYDIACRTDKTLDRICSFEENILLKGFL